MATLTETATVVMNAVRGVVRLMRTFSNYKLVPRRLVIKSVIFLYL